MGARIHGGTGIGPGFLLWRAALRWQREVTSALRPLGLTHVQFVLLEGLWRFDAQGRCPSQRELADRAGTDVMMTSQVVRVLEGKGLLRRAVDPSDARKRVLTITDEGRGLAERAIEVVRGTDDAYFAGVPDRAALLVALTRLAFPGH
ncbi:MULTISPECIES: MarR family winged helix-turn-helix transcriptional regulator [Thermomonospora]|mgnify:FL=1|uniref:Transcriptional regulator, MarR family n=1 Tax=Thermomonospora curvata (strain ATCC 19995 / DSM 43183 / JCM 3096 / KCTC 9072 / NBRC 15933 / NCIMB 10081 / Henssen B9) TaxID=471852 RepID=D1A8J5_THECD|nr:MULTISPECIES: MarR family transcriptional regulator [Thermomonospora]ACY96690.1 transcriptional regulator, MarR family [Thermomonospora curvata DSM 43183]PKK15483.1 MAG: MarR family transcriptional regulator [Thermomonospora sp. CIF 1]